jgi:hypothetical protein
MGGAAAEAGGHLHADGALEALVLVVRLEIRLQLEQGAHGERVAAAPVDASTHAHGPVSRTAHLERSSHPRATKLPRTASACALVMVPALSSETSRSASSDETEYASRGASMICSTCAASVSGAAQAPQTGERTIALKYAISGAPYSVASCASASPLRFTCARVGRGCARAARERDSRARTSAGRAPRPARAGTRGRAG